MKRFLPLLILTVQFFTYDLQGQTGTNKNKEYNVVYLLHLKRYAAWPWMHEAAKKHTPKSVISRDTMHIVVNDMYTYQSPGTNAAPNSITILLDIIEVRFPKGDSIHVNFKTTSSIFPKYAILNRSFDTTFTISEVKQNDFYFLAYRLIPPLSRKNLLAWRLFDSQNTRKQLARRLQNMLMGNTAHTITIE